MLIGLDGPAFILRTFHRRPGFEGCDTIECALRQDYAMTLRRVHDCRLLVQAGTLRARELTRHRNHA